MVRLAGIEPTTPWFVAKYSIQLSYSREALYVITIEAALWPRWDWRWPCPRDGHSGKVR